MNSKCALQTDLGKVILTNLNAFQIPPKLYHTKKTDRMRYLQVNLNTKLWGLELWGK